MNKGLILLGEAKKKDRFDGLFSIQSEGLVWNDPRGAWNCRQAYGITL